MIELSGRVLISLNEVQKLESRGPQPDKFRTPDEFRNGNLACWSAVSGRLTDGWRTDTGRSAEAGHAGSRNRGA
jgi:hypothetical protein